jgi:uncharacterized membrane protein YtjA (UPF0391 family)
MVRYSIGFLVILIFTAILAFGGISVVVDMIVENLLYILLPPVVILSLFRAFMFQIYQVEKK